LAFFIIVVGDVCSHVETICQLNRELGHLLTSVRVLENPLLGIHYVLHECSVHVPHKQQIRLAHLGQHQSPLVQHLLVFGERFFEIFEFVDKGPVVEYLLADE